jgi:aspartate kinase
MGKTTAGLERALRAAWEGQWAETETELAAIALLHRETVQALELDQSAGAAVETLLLDLQKAMAPGARKQQADAETAFDAHYDRIVAFGERLSSTLLAATLDQERSHRSEARPKQGHVRLLDARKLIRTNDRHREALVDLEQSFAALRQAVDASPDSLAVLPGFIGASPEGATTTLGLEGSDYTAALAAAALDAASVTLWKNVPGVFQADPARFPEALPLPQLDYSEVFQMTNYGAKVIHPKTMQPLEKAGIPLFVRSFLDPAAPGTRIGAEAPEQAYPPITVVVEDLRWLQLRQHAMAYLSERDIARIFALLREQRAKAYCTEIGRMTLSLGIWVDPRRWEALLQALEASYAVRAESGLELVTVRHPARRDGQSKLWPQRFDNRTVRLEQRSGVTYQCLHKA